jgi:hypothetical protein
MRENTLTVVLLLTLMNAPQRADVTSYHSSCPYIPCEGGRGFAR